MGHYPKLLRWFLLASLVVSSTVTLAEGQGHGQRNPRMGGKGANQAKPAQQRAQQQKALQQRAAQRRAEQDRARTGEQQKTAPVQDQQRNRATIDQQRPQPRPGQNQPPVNPAQQQIRQLILQRINLNPQQQERMVKISHSHDDEAAEKGRALRLARQSLEQAIMNPQYNEAEVNRRIEVLAQAQADQVRLNQRIRAEIRQVLTPEQVMKFNQLQREMQQKQQEQKRIEMLQQNPDKSPSSAEQSQGSQQISVDMLDVFTPRGK